MSGAKDTSDRFEFFSGCGVSRGDAEGGVDDSAIDRLNAWMMQNVGVRVISIQLFTDLSRGASDCSLAVRLKTTRT